MGFLQRILGFFTTVWETIFSDVAAAVAGVAAFPIIGTINSVLSLILSVICLLFDFICAGATTVVVLGDFDTLDFFDVFFSSDIYYSLFQTFAFSLLSLIYIFQIMKSLSGPMNSDADDPLGLTCRTFVSGVLIVTVRPVVSFFSKLFASLYKFILGDDFYHLYHDATGNISLFSTFAENAKTTINDSFAAGGIDIRAQIQTCIIVIILIFVTTFVGWKLLNYLIEMVERYVILAILMITAPLAAVFFASNSTKRSAQAWVRMVASQLMLMVFGVFFLRLFYEAYGNFTTAFTELQAIGSGGNIATIILWLLLVFAILHVGSKIDSHLKTLGLSAAECGGELFASIMAEGGNIFHIAEQFEATYALTKAFASGSNTFVRNTITRMSNFSNRVRTRTAQATTPGEINNIANMTKGAAPLAVGRATGQAVKDSIKGISRKQRDMIDTGTVKVAGGIISFKTLPDKKTKARTDMVLVPVPAGFSQIPSYRASDRAEANRMEKARGSLPDGGRMVKIGEQEYMMYASGPSARHLMVSNPVMKHHMENLEKQSGGNIRVIQAKDVRYEKTEDGKLVPKIKENSNTGAYKAWVRDPKNPGFFVMREWVPLSQFTVDPSLNPVFERHGGQEYAVYDIHRTPGGAQTVEQAKNFDTFTAAQKVEWLQNQFPSLAGKQIEDVQFSRNVYQAKIDGRESLVFPVLQYGVAHAGYGGQTVQLLGKNGSQYAVLDYSEIKPDVGEVKMASFTRNEGGTPVEDREQDGGHQKPQAPVESAAPERTIQDDLLFRRRRPSVNVLAEEVNRSSISKWMADYQVRVEEATHIQQENNIQGAEVVGDSDSVFVEKHNSAAAPGPGRQHQQQTTKQDKKRLQGNSISNEAIKRKTKKGRGTKE